MGTILPVEYFHKLALFDVGKLVGISVKVDFATDSVSRARYARVCIESSLSKPLISRVWVVNACQQVEYENLDSLCMKCGIVGHLMENCGVKENGNVEGIKVGEGRSPPITTTLTSMAKVSTSTPRPTNAPL